MGETESGLRFPNVAQTSNGTKISREKTFLVRALVFVHILLAGLLQWPLQPFPAADTCPITVKKANTQSCGVVMNTLSPCKMIKY